MPAISESRRAGRATLDEGAVIQWPAATRPSRTRGERLSVAIFTGVNVAVFLILVGCVFAAAVLYNRWH